MRAEHAFRHGYRERIGNYIFKNVGRIDDGILLRGGQELASVLFSDAAW